MDVSVDLMAVLQLVITVDRELIVIGTLFSTGSIRCSSPVNGCVYTASPQRPMECCVCL